MNKQSSFQTSKTLLAAASVMLILQNGCSLNPSGEEIGGGEFEHPRLGSASHSPSPSNFLPWDTAHFLRTQRDGQRFGPVHGADGRFVSFFGKQIVELQIDDIVDRDVELTPVTQESGWYNPQNGHRVDDYDPTQLPQPPEYTPRPNFQFEYLNLFSGDSGLESLWAVVDGNYFCSYQRGEFSGGYLIESVPVYPFELSQIVYVSQNKFLVTYSHHNDRKITQLFEFSLSSGGIPKFSLLKLPGGLDESCRIFSDGAGSVWGLDLHSNCVFALDGNYQVHQRIEMPVDFKYGYNSLMSNPLRISMFDKRNVVILDVKNVIWLLNLVSGSVHKLLDCSNFVDATLPESFHAQVIDARTPVMLREIYSIQINRSGILLVQGSRGINLFSLRRRGL